MSFFRGTFPLLFSILAWSGASAAGQDGDPGPFQAIADAVTITRYPVPPGPSAGFPQRARAALAHAIDRIVADRGTPQAVETLPDGSRTQLIYPDALIVVTGYYSSAIVCRIDIRPAALREAVDVGQIIALAGNTCRNAEVRGWASAGLLRSYPIVTQSLPGLPAATVQMFATEYLGPLFDALVRSVEMERNTRSLLVREGFRDEPLPRAGIPVWRYAWFADGSFLAVRQDMPADEQWRDRAIRLTCVVRGPARALPRLDGGPFADWCTSNAARLRPRLADYVAAVSLHAAARERDRAAGTRDAVMPSLGPGFHGREVPPGLAATFWASGTVPQPNRP